MKSKLLIFLIIIILLTDLAYFYPELTGFFTKESYPRQYVNVTRIIDGDTIEIQTGILEQKARLKGINTPEKNHPFFLEAKSFLELLENKTIEIENHGQDKYNRLLVYVFYNNNLINKQILEKGLGNLYYYEEDFHYQKLSKAENSARQNEKGIWKKSQNSYCIELIDFSFKEPEILVLQNLCDFKLEITIKDEATHIYKETIEPNRQLTKTFSHIWNDDGDSIYIWDESGLLLYYNY